MLDTPSYLLGKKAGGGGGTSDYSALTNKPSINGIELNGNKTSEDLGINTKLDEELPIYELVIPSFNKNVSSYTRTALTTTECGIIKTLFQKIYDNGDENFMILLRNSNLSQQALLYCSKKLNEKPTIFNCENAVDNYNNTSSVYINLQFTIFWQEDTISMIANGVIEKYPNRYLKTNNTNEYTPTGNYNPSTKLYTDKTHYENMAGYDATKTQVLKNINGTLTWVDE